MKTCHPEVKVCGEAPACEIVTIGSEILLGQIEDSNTSFLAREMGLLGVHVRFRTAVGDNLEEIIHVLGTAAGRSEFILVTGGLGPTLDDLTREAVARSAGVELEFRQDLMDHIEGIFKKAGYRMSENNRRQAYIPYGSRPVPNPVGTAPGFIKDIKGKPVICLPGVPMELKYLMKKEVIPWIRGRFDLGSQVIIYRVLKAVGIGESMVDRVLGDLIVPGENPEVGLLASAGEITIRVKARGGNEKEAFELIKPVQDEIRSRLGNKIYGEDEETLEGVIDSLLAGKGLTLAILETFTGGLMTMKFSEILSKNMIEGLITPHMDQMTASLDCPEPDVSEQGALFLAERVRRRSGAEVGAVLLGFPKLDEGGDTYELEGFAAVRLLNNERCYSWKMGGRLSNLKQRGAVIGLNTLRLSLQDV